MTLDDVIRTTEEKMGKTFEVLGRDLRSVRVGLASPGMLDKIIVDYYGTQTPVSQMASIAVTEPRVLTIQPWDKSAIAAIEKAILKSDLGITPMNDGAIIRLVVPQLTAERRQEIVKSMKKRGEETRVALRNIRREGLEEIKKTEKDKLCSEDEAKKTQDRVQKLTDKYIKEVDAALETKEQEIVAV
ncbi:MAG: ribosome recycling factor [Gracilibacteraceae bacterium]|jgi:ribosome recycling factor|nr:ribosome recycling factor [Gracilibacteraceae bacterium]